MSKTSIVSSFHTFLFGFLILFLSSCQQNPISETGYSTTDLNVPEFSYAGASGTGYVRKPMSVAPSSLNDNGFAPTCTILPALPQGLSINPSTCVISGTPVNLLSPTNYIVTATNAAGLTKQSVVLKVLPSEPTISYPAIVGLVNIPFTMTPTLYDNFSNMSGCSTTPALPAGFQIDPNTCVISGQSYSYISSQVYTVTATNGIGSSTTPVTLIVASPPILSYSGVSGSGSVANAMSVAPSTFDIQGAALTGCTISPALPQGLFISESTCVISGTPSVTDSTNYTVTATNPAGSSTASISLNIIPSPPAISYNGVSGLGFVAIPFLAAPSLLDDNRALITGCQSTPNLPTGLTIHPNTCVISGTPSGVSSSSPYTIRATNSAGYTDISFSISISPSAPTISYAGVSGAGVYNSSFTMAPSILNVNGAAIQSCTITPSLPSGLTINNSNCAISGTPLEARSSQIYSITVMNIAGSSTVSISLSVSAIAPTLSYSASTGKTGNAQSSRSITPSSLDGGGVAVTNCTISPSLPSGLSLNGSTCAISGTPLEESAQTTYTVTITNAAGLTGVATLPITVSAIPPTISYSASTGDAFSSRTITPTINHGGSTISNCSATLPAGLTINPLTCVISGTPTTAQAATNHTVTITTGAGLTATTSASITIDAVLPVISYDSSTGLTGDIYGARTITPSTLQNGGLSASCSISPTLPAGLSFNTSTCVISGSPTEILSATLYTVTITNSVGVDTGEFTLSVNPKAPTLTYSTSSGTVGTLLTINPGSFNDNGAAIISCTSTGLPAGLSVDSSCVISGTPTTAGSASYTITATNSVGPTNATITITIAAIAPTLSYSGASGTSGQVNTAMSISPTGLTTGGSPISSCTASSLPANLSINNSTCIISGNPTTAQSAATYTITVTNSANLTATATVSLTIAAALPTVSYSGSSTGNIHSARTTSPSSFYAGGAATTCSISPTLPAGLSINNSCVISGTPTVSSGLTNYTVTVSNSAGNGTATLALSVSAIAPTISYSSATGTRNSLMTINPATINDNGATISCTASSLPSGLALNSSTCVISGTPSVTATATNYTITATNSAGSTNATISITINSDTVTITQYTTYRGWSNGTFARTCLEYRSPTAPYQYSGATGNSTATASTFYRIDPDGAGAIAPLNVSCDMTNGGWTSLTAMSTTSVGYIRGTGGVGGGNPSGDLVTSNAAAFSAIAALSTQQTVNYSASFNGASSTYTCPYPAGSDVGGGCYIDSNCNASRYTGNSYGFICHQEFVYENGVPMYCDHSGAYSMCIGAGYSDVSSTGSGGMCSCSVDCVRYNYSSCGFYGVYDPDCVVTIKFLNSANTEISRPFSGAASVSTTGTSLTTNVGASGVNAVRKIETVTSCLVSGSNPSGGVNFSSATVKFK